MKHKARVHASYYDPPFCSDPSIFVDQFDRLPDCLVLLIFNKLLDVKSLSRCSAVSKRFNSLVHLVNDVYVKIDHVLTGDGAADEAINQTSDKTRNVFSYYFKLMLFNILKPFNQLQNPDGEIKPFSPKVSQHSPAHILKNFKEIHNLKIELPAGDVATEDGVMLKWRAEFGSTLRNCVILGGMKTSELPSLEGPIHDHGSMPESFFTNGGLKLRVVWTICSLIAASTRHYLLRDIIKDHPSLKSLVFTDADGQGTLYMGLEQLKEFRNSPYSASQSANRTQVPASKMKLKYAPYLELLDGTFMQKATIVEIKPDAAFDTSGNNVKKQAEELASGSFDEPFGTALKALAKQRTYLLEMNGF